VKELRAQVVALQPAPIEGYNMIQNDERRTVEILHRNELERLDGERRLQYDKLIHDFLVFPYKYYPKDEDPLLMVSSCFTFFSETFKI